MNYVVAETINIDRRSPDQKTLTQIIMSKVSWPVKSLDGMIRSLECSIDIPIQSDYRKLIWMYIKVALSILQLSAMIDKTIAITPLGKRIPLVFVPKALGRY